ncbi:MAG: spore germination protein [Bacilli bacterium]|nr:spore germination protein [Bacilli bacterium]
MNIDILKKLQKEAPDLKIRTINNINIIFFETLCNSNDINDFILKPIVMNNINDYSKLIKIPFGNYKEINNEKDLFFCLYSGFTIINIKNKFIACETKYPLNSSISEATNEKVVKGPKDAFTENYQNNIGLIRKRIRSKDLKVNEYVVGSESKTKVGLLYLDNVCDKDLVNEIDTKIKNIDIDYLLSINNNICKKSYTFPTYIMTERPDLVSFMLMEGRIVIITENNQEVLIIPTFFIDIFKSIDDHYQNRINVTITRIIRIIAFLTSIIVPGLYIALTTFNQETLPTSVLINFSMQREGVPFPSFIEAIILWVTFEILREADTRVPFVVGSSMSIVGALVLGQAAVEAGLISPIMIIVIAISSVSSFLFNDNDVVNSIRIWKLIFLILGSFTGLYGIFIGTVLFFTRICSIKSFSYDYIKEKL